MTHGLRRARTALAIVWLAACNGDSGSIAPAAKPSAESAAPSSSFAWVAVRPSAAALPEEYPARILRAGESEAVVVAQLPARVAQLVKKPGDLVEKGTPVALVVMPEFDAAGATVAGADASIAVLEARRLRLASLAKEGLVREAEVGDVDLELTRHRAERIRASAVIQSAGAPGGMVILRSPLAGVLVEVAALLGELRRPEDGPIARVREKSGHRVEATLPNLPANDAAYRLHAAGTDHELTLINPVAATNGLGYLTWFEAKPGTELPAASEGRLHVGTLADPGTLHLVPASAVGQVAGKAFVVSRVKADAPPTRVEVELVRVAGSEALVRGPLAEE